MACLLLLDLMTSYNDYRGHGHDFKNPAQASRRFPIFNDSTMGAGLGPFASGAIVNPLTCGPVI